MQKLWSFFYLPPPHTHPSAAFPELFPQSCPASYHQRHHDFRLSKVGCSSKPFPHINRIVVFVLLYNCTKSNNLNIISKHKQRAIYVLLQGGFKSKLSHKLCVNEMILCYQQTRTEKNPRAMTAIVAAVNQSNSTIYWSATGMCSA